MNTAQIMIPDEIFNKILSYCIDVDTFKIDINKEAAIEKITMKNVKLEPIGHFTANVIDEIKNSSRYAILEQLLGRDAFYRMDTICIDHTITDYRILFEPDDYTYGWLKSLTADIKFTYNKTKKRYSASLINIRDKVEIVYEDDDEDENEDENEDEDSEDDEDD